MGHDDDWLCGIGLLRLPSEIERHVSVSLNTRNVAKIERPSTGRPFFFYSSAYLSTTDPNENRCALLKLLVVIVSYRVAHLAIDCLRSVADEIGRVPGTHVAVCENGTGDNSAERIRDAIDQNGWASWCTLTTLDVNLGFTGGNNVSFDPRWNRRTRRNTFCC